MFRGGAGDATREAVTKASLPARLFWTAYLGWHWRGQARFPFTSRARIEAAQSRRVRRMVRHAYSSVPFYQETMRRLGVTPEDFRSAADLARLPVIERDDLKKDPEYFRSMTTSRATDLSTRTGGSTGAPREVWWDTAGVFQNAAHAERERSIIAGIVGRFVNYRETVIGSSLSSDLDIQAIYRDRALLPSRARVQYQHLSITETPEKNLALIDGFRPDVIRTYGSYLGRLLLLMHATPGAHRPKAVFYDADELPESVRRIASEELKIPIISAYQAVEAFKIGFECEEHIGFHVNADIYPVSVVNGNGREVVPGESGDVIVSNLVNRATVLLNYRLGDVAHFIPEPCPCGRNLPLLSFIEGRTDDWIALPSGESVHPQIIRTIFTNEQAVSQYQVVQHRFDQFTVAIVAASDREAMSTRVGAKFRERFGSSAQVEITFVDSIEPSRSGKVRPVISLIDQRK